MVRLALCWILLLGVSFAQSINVEAEITPEAVRIGEAATLKIRVSGPANWVDIDPPRVEGATVRRGGQTSQTVWTNGNLSQNQTFNFLIYPHQVGTQLIGPVDVKVDRIPFKTKAVTLKVEKGSPGTSNPGYSYDPSWPSRTRNPIFDPWADQARQADPVRVRSEANPKTVYQNQGILYKLTFLNSVRLRRDSRYDAISPTGFLKLEFPQKSGEETIDGIPFAKSEVSTMFFPLSPGEYKLPSTLIRAYPFFRIGPVQVHSDAHEVKVKPLPIEGRPREFGGAVGQFSFTASLDSVSGRVGKPLTLICKVRGNGHADLVTDFPLPKIPGFRVYETESEGSTQVINGEVVAEKTFRTVLIPETSGNRVISGIRFAYFDPLREKFMVESAGDLKIKVARGDLQPEASQPEQDEPEKLGPSSGTFGGASLYFESKVFWWLQVLPLLAWLGLVGFPSAAKAWNARPKKAPKQNLRKEFNKAESVSDLARSTRIRLDRLIGGSGWRLAELPQRLAEFEVPEAVAHQLADLLHSLDQAAYSSPEETPELETFKKTLLPLLKQLPEERP